MTKVTASIHWNRTDQPFIDSLYSRRHSWTFDGGAVVNASSSPHVVALPFSDPTAVDPEEAFVASLSSCHMLWFLSLAAKRGYRVDSYLDNAFGEMGKNEHGKMVMLSVTLCPVIKWSSKYRPTTEEIAALHEQAHAECFIANSVKTAVRIRPMI